MEECLLIEAGRRAVSKNVDFEVSMKRSTCQVVVGSGDVNWSSSKGERKSTEPPYDHYCAQDVSSTGKDASAISRGLHERKAGMIWVKSCDKCGDDMPDSHHLLH